MIHNSEHFSGPCACGRTHSMTTRLAILEAECMRDFDSHTQSLGITGSRAAIYDSNTYRAKGLIRPTADKEIILKADGLLADEKSVATVLKALDPDTQALIAIGGGTLHDIVRYCANKLGIPFISCPTAASTGSYCAVNSHMILEGKPTIVPAQGPMIALVDTEVLRQAPSRLTAAGMGEILSKTIALVDARIAELLAGETTCAKVAAMVRQGILMAIGSREELARGSKEAYAQMAYGLLLTGLSTQMSPQARQRSAPELLLALMDLLPKTYGAKDDALSGEILGVWAVLLADLYHQTVQNDVTASCLVPYHVLPDAFWAQHFGSLAQDIAARNARDSLSAIQPEGLIKNWQEIQRTVSNIPSGEEMAAMLACLDAPVSPEEIGLSAMIVPQMLTAAPCLGKEPTLLSLQRLLKLRYSKSAEASRAPFRSKRYVDKAMIRAGKSSAVSASSIK